ncbi:MAG: murE/murF fusion protein [Desulfobacteraceae bacterium Eth-SRB1]|nr:MAG: murE/murF fusion protein [Desulfobacteraceae bacterium Eth-SRB1]
MILSHLLKSIKPKRVTYTNKKMQQHNTEIMSIHYNSQDVRQNGLFVAIPGLVADGHDFIDAALTNGASALITQKPVTRDTITIEVDNTRKALAAVSAMFYGNPSESLFIIGIIGTNGKTTTAYLIENILSKAGFKVGVIGTINYHYSGKTFNNPVTTPESLDLQRILSEMLNNGITHVVMEVSSHSIDLHRIENCRFDVGVFTNLTQDHLDYHKDMDSYWACKKRFFTDILRSGPKKDMAAAVINCDDEKGKELAKSLMVDARSSKLKILQVSDQTIQPKKIKYDPAGIMGTIATTEGEFDFKSPFVGKHNLKNIICATGVGIALNIPLAVIKTGIEETPCVRGRLETVPNNIGRFIYVDYAHTPDALKQVLLSLRSLTRGRIICIFGCGGDRDKEKRPKMGEIAGRFSDLSIITSDNPRTEEPMEIIRQVLDGVEKAVKALHKKKYIVEPDRKKAILSGITASQPGDTVLIAGKGHETYQIIGNETIPFDDRKEAEKVLLSEAGKAKPEKQNPIPWSTAEILKATNGEIISGNTGSSFAGISIDSRRISAGDIFIAIKGNVYDGHSFAGDVIEHGIRGIIINKDKADNLLPFTKQQGKNAVCVAVNDTTKALGDLASFNRKRSNVSVVAITGSNGKTTTKDMTAAVASRKYCTLSTEGNFNNEIGLPLTLLRLNPDHKWAVLELGMNSPNEIGRLADICSPDIGVITNISHAHLKGLGSINGIMHAKGELLEKIKPGGKAVLNADDPRVLQLADKTTQDVLLFGLSKDAMIRAVSIKEKEHGISFSLMLPAESISIDLGVSGTFMVSNALAAAAVGYLLGESPMEIKAGLENFIPAHGRMNILMSRGIHIIDDTYNANPDSMKAAIMTLKALKENNRGILVAGDMLELGEYAESMHKMIGSLAAASDIAKLYVTGEFAETVARGAKDKNAGFKDIFIGSKEEILKDLIDWLRPGDWVLVKGSRTMGMEKIVEGLRNK